MDFGYDYDSVMHYDMYAFSGNGQATMVPKVSWATIGNRVYLSEQDAREIMAAYSGGNKSSVSIINTVSVLVFLIVSFKIYLF